MERLDLGLFSLEQYKDDNKEHKELATIFEGNPNEEENDFRTYVGSVIAFADFAKSSIKKGKYAGVYFAYIGDTLVGMIGLYWLTGSPHIVIAILPEHRGHHYSKQLYQEYTNYVFEAYQEYEAIYVDIHPTNTHSIENALAAGFEQLDKYKYVKTRRNLHQ